ncbi:MAG TPA: DNA polymerase IV [Erysipelotrichaceae bacterium]|nr:DNA polymerase IV [Erysipelotrichaceae bacterium]
MAHVYFHIDLNAFFANAEILLDPSLKGKPLVVSGKTRRSVVSTASYEARKYGIHSAMPVSEAQKRCRELIIVEGHYEWYRELSSRFMDIIRSYTDIIEQASIDECYADMTEVIQKYERPLDLAWTIQRRVLQETGIPCSVGIGPNMFLAKMASDMKKPMGITVLRIREVKERLWPLPIGDMRGVGNKTVPVLEEMGIHTIGDLASWKDITSLSTVFGKNTEEIIRRANGYDDREIVTEYDAKSMGVSETLLEDVTDYEELRGLIRLLSRKLSKRLRNSHKAGYRVSVRICYYDFRNNDRSVKLDHPVFKADDLFLGAISLFDDNWDEGEAVRLLGISVSDLISDEKIVSQMSLFDEAQESREETADILAELNRMTGNKAFVRASALLDTQKK